MKLEKCSVVGTGNSQNLSNKLEINKTLLPKQERHEESCGSEVQGCWSSNRCPASSSSAPPYRRSRRDTERWGGRCGSRRNVWEFICATALWMLSGLYSIRHRNALKSHTKYIHFLWSATYTTLFETLVANTLGVWILVSVARNLGLSHIHLLPFLV